MKLPTIDDIVLLISISYLYHCREYSATYSPAEISDSKY